MKMAQMIVAVALLCGFTVGQVVAQDSGYSRAFVAEDSAPVWKVMNQGNENVQIEVTNAAWGNIFVVIGTLSNTINCASASYDTVAEVATAIAAATNSSGTKPLKVEYWCSLGTDTISNRIITATNKIAAANHEWSNIGTWDTSALLAYNTALPPGDNPKVLRRIDGNIGGTGNVTLDVYKYNDDNNVQSKVGSWTFVSPQYVWTQMTSTTITNVPDNVGPGVINLPVEVSVSRSEGILVKASRATTATTGGLGITAELRK